MSTAGQYVFFVVSLLVAFWSLASMLSAVGVRHASRSFSAGSVFVFDQGARLAWAIAVAGVLAAFVGAAVLAVGILT